MLANLNDVLIPAQKAHYAVGMFDIIDTDMLEAAITAAEELQSPIIIGTAEVLLPYGELRLLAPAFVAAAKRASVPVVVHYDHGFTVNRCREALELGYTSIMFDGSAEDITENINGTRELVRQAHVRGATVEGEIGHVGQTSGWQTEAGSYTTPEDAVYFLAETGADALAVAIGTAHGTYREPPRLDLERLKAIRSCVETPLVLHGGSGLSDDDFRRCISGGIAKINIFTDLCTAGKTAMREGLVEELSYLAIRNKKVEALREAMKTKIRLFGSANQALVSDGNSDR